MMGFFYYQGEKQLMLDLEKSSMQNIASKISAQIIFSHMSGTPFDNTLLTSFPNYTVALYANPETPLYGKMQETLDFKTEIKKYGERYILIDNSTYGHLDVDYVVVKEWEMQEMMEGLLLKTLLFFAVIYALIAVVGFYLGKLFLKPIIHQRHTMNRFIKDTTHELNTPITSLLMSMESGSMSEKNVERMKLSAQRISQIYKDLTYLFLQNHQDKGEQKLLYLDILLKEQVEYLRAFAQKKRVTIHEDIDPTTFHMSKEDFMRLTNNLISNAIKYNKIGGEIFIVLKNNTLSIQDTGIGIELSKQEDIFKRYFRATKTQGGFGLGLNIVKDICLRYEIEIQLTSQPTKGSTFKLKF